MTVFERLCELHQSTLPETATWRDKSFNFMSNRLFKYPRYCSRINNGRISVVSNKALIVAFISGMSDIEERKKSKFAHTDEWLECDEKFYMGIWEILCELFAPEGATIAPPPLVSDARRMVLGSDGSITKYNLIEKCDDYLSFAMLNDVDGLTSRNKVSYFFNLPKGWLALHNELDKQSPREFPADKLLRVVLGMFTLDYLAKPEPKPSYFLDYAYTTWEKLYHVLSDDLAFAQEQRARYIKENK